LTEHLDNFVARQVASGRYSNASEIVREALSLLEEQEQERKATLNALRLAAKQGFDEIDQGKGIVVKGKKEISQFIRDIETEVRTNAAKNGV
jgi:antitoxin ParD1/3/4